MAPFGRMPNHMLSLLSLLASCFVLPLLWCCSVPFCFQLAIIIHLQNAKTPYFCSWNNVKSSSTFLSGARRVNVPRATSQERPSCPAEGSLMVFTCCLVQPSSFAVASVMHMYEYSSSPGVGAKVGLTQGYPLWQNANTCKWRQCQLGLALGSSGSIMCLLASKTMRSGSPCQCPLMTL